VTSPLRRAARSVARVGAAAQNALEVARFGGLETGDEPSPYEVVASGAVHRLRRYFPERAEDRPDRPPVVLVPPLMVSAEVYDVSPSTSGVAALAARGIDPWVVDFGAPEHEQGGLDRTITDHVLAISEAVDEVRAVTGQDVHLGGYSQGGMFCYQTAAYRRSDGVASLVTFGSPVDTHGGMPFGLPEELVSRVAGAAAGPVRNLTLPAWAVRWGFQLLDPVKTARQRLDFLLQLHDREALLPRESQRRFLDGEGWVAYAGPAIADLLEQFVHHNRMLEGGFVIDGRLVTLADIDRPTLCFVGEVDEIARPVTVRGILRAAPRADVYERRMPAGHFGLVVGSKAVDITWPTVAGWVRHVLDEGDVPDGVEPMTEAGGEDEDAQALHLQFGLELATDVGVGVVRSLARATESVVDTVVDVAGAGVEQLPRLVRLQRARRDTPMSMGRLLARQARQRPDATFFLFEDRAHTWSDATTRIDNVVRGLLHVGVRQGEHVGVLMGTRPSALALVAALSRVGAVAVMLRPDGPLAREAQLGQVTRIVADPEHAAAARGAGDVPVLVLGGGGEPRELGFGLTDMERIDPDAVTVPAWYRPNPGRAEDLAFILFTGAGDHTRVNRITNRRWALSAYGTASAARLSEADTVYAVTPIHHPSGLLTSIGGAVAGGARLALATSFDPATFWSEVRRYGVTIVSYTWTLCRDLVEAPTNPVERHHPVRLFVGSGMPAGLWRRVVDRFAPAGVLEFYASTEGGVVLGNTSGKKVGSKGRPLPGSADVAVAAYDIDAGRLVERPDGFAVRCRPGEVGMLLARVDHTRSPTVASPLRGVFERDDAWVATGDLFEVDADGDHWWVDDVVALVHTSRGAVGTVPVERHLEGVAGVDLVAVYGVRPAPDRDEVVVAAITERDGATIDPDELTAAVLPLPDHHRPAVVRVLDEMPRTTWFRPRKVPLRAAGLPDDDTRAWAWDDRLGRYVPLGEAADDVAG
jgi:putative long chain acyl-CoA synthase